MRKLYITSPQNFSHNYPDTMYEYEFVISNDISLNASTIKLRSYQSITNGIEPDNFQSVPFKSLKKYNEDTKSWIEILPDTILHASEIHGTYRGIIEGGDVDKKISLYLRLVDSRTLTDVLYSSVIHNVSTMTNIEVLNEIETDKLVSYINVRNFIEYNEGELDTDYSIEYKVTNNLNDDSPSWETLDNSFVNSTEFYMFNNRTAQNTPKIGVRTTLIANPSATGKVIKVKDIYIGYQ